VGVPKLGEMIHAEVAWEIEKKHEEEKRAKAEHPHQHHHRHRHHRPTIPLAAGSVSPRKPPIKHAPKSKPVVVSSSSESSSDSSSGSSDYYTTTDESDSDAVANHPRRRPGPLDVDDASPSSPRNGAHTQTKSSFLPMIGSPKHGTGTEYKSPRIGSPRNTQHNGSQSARPFGAETSASISMLPASGALPPIFGPNGPAASWPLDGPSSARPSHEHEKRRLKIYYETRARLQQQRLESTMHQLPKIIQSPRGKAHKMTGGYFQPDYGVSDPKEVVKKSRRKRRKTHKGKCHRDCACDRPEYV
jgi:hypothetical protein